LRAGVLVGDLATDHDARRLAGAAARVRQITTGTVCHLDAEMVAGALDGWDLEALDLLFLENVGNLVCPSSYDLGESLRAVLFAVTEGEDKPLKYPTIYNSADLTVITKLDLAEAAGFDRELALGNLDAVRPGMEVLETSARTGAGIETWVGRLTAQAAAVRSPGAPGDPARRLDGGAPQPPPDPARTGRPAS
jgi:hydrogenase nickel incorporation protein HypB